MITDMEITECAQEHSPKSQGHPHPQMLKLKLYCVKKKIHVSIILKHSFLVGTKAFTRTVSITTAGFGSGRVHVVKKPTCSPDLSSNKNKW